MTLTGKDLDAIGNLMKLTIREDETLVRKSDISHLPTNEQFSTENAKLMTELKAIRDEQTALSGLNKKLNDHDDQIKKIQSKLHITPSF
ncbi:MAG: hypothetical protein AAB656_00820 [Patescibacteria group bacterium]